MPGRRRTVHEHIPRRSGESDGHAVKVLRKLDLAAEATRVGEAERHVEHVVLVVGGLGELVEVFFGEDDMTSRAGDRALACALGEVGVSHFGVWGWEGGKGGDWVAGGAAWEEVRYAEDGGAGQEGSGER